MNYLDLKTIGVSTQFNFESFEALTELDRDALKDIIMNEVNRFLQSNVCGIHAVSMGMPTIYSFGFTITFTVQYFEGNFEKVEEFFDNFRETFQNWVKTELKCPNC